MNTEPATAAALQDPWEVIPQLVFDHASEVAKGLFLGLLEPDIGFVTELCAKMLRAHGVDGAFATAVALTEAFTSRTRVGAIADALPPGMSASVAVHMPGAPPLFAPAEQYLARRETAMAFTQGYLDGVDAHAALYTDMQTRDDHHQLLHGLCELVALTIPPRQAS